MERLMNKTQENMEKMIALLLIVYAIALLVGENLRDYLSGYHDLVSRIDLLQVSGYHDLVFRRDFQPKSRDLVKKPAFSLSQVTSVENCLR
jgi:hypothetical protein